MPESIVPLRADQNTAGSLDAFEGVTRRQRRSEDGGGDFPPDDGLDNDPDEVAGNGESI